MTLNDDQRIILDLHSLTHRLQQLPSLFDGLAVDFLIELDLDREHRDRLRYMRKNWCASLREIVNSMDKICEDRIDAMRALDSGKS